MAVESLLLGALLCAVAYLCRGTVPTSGRAVTESLREQLKNACAFLARAFTRSSYSG